jgi:uncharacterized protein
VVSLLLGRGADATRAEGSYTPLMRASARGHADVVTLLLAHGCGDVDLQPARRGWTALRYACSSGHVRVVRLLLGAGADPTLVDNGGDTPLSDAVRGGHVECVGVLKVSNAITCCVWKIL